MSTALSKRGYGLLKSSLKNEEDIKNKLTVKPSTVSYDESTDKSFSVYLESSKKLYVPKYWGLKHFGLPDENNIHDGASINCQFTGSLRDYQREPINAYMTAANDPLKKGGILQLPPGWGKTVMALYILCKLKVKTLIIVHKEFLMNQWKDRIAQYISDVSVGILKQNVIEHTNDIVIASLQSLSMRKYEDHVLNDFGLVIIDECFPYGEKIHTDKGLMKIGTMFEKWEKNEKMPNVLSYNQNLKKFEYKRLTYVWRKEREELIKIKMSKRIINCTPEHKILTTKGYIEGNKLQPGYLIISKYNTKNVDFDIAPALNEDQFQIVYGSILGQGNVDVSKDKRYRLRITHSENQKEYYEWKKLILKGGGSMTFTDYSQTQLYSFRTRMFDMEDELKKNTKSVPDWLLNKLDARGIAIWFMDAGYISNNISIIHSNFGLNVNNRFVEKFKQYDIHCSIKIKKRNQHYLHFDQDNTQKLFNLISQFIHESIHHQMDCYTTLLANSKYTWNSEYLNYGTLRVSSVIPFKNKGVDMCTKPYVYDIEVEDNHNFVIGSKNGYVDGPVVSNCHHMAAAVFSKALLKVNFTYALGLSATVTRKDGLTKVFKWFLGDIVYKAKPKESDSVQVVMKYYYESDNKYNHIPLLYNGKPNIAKIINNVCEYIPRTTAIIDELDKILKIDKDREVIILSDRRNHLQDIEKNLNDKGYDSIGYYVGGMREKDLKESENKRIILGTYNMVSEGFDLPKLNTLVLASPKSDVEQSVGRIQRQLKEDRQYIPIVLDIVDQFSLFTNQGVKRKNFYKKKGFEITEKDKLDNKVELKGMAFHD